MTHGLLRRPGMLGAMCALAVTMLAAAGAHAGCALRRKDDGRPRPRSFAATFLSRIKITQRLNQQLPLMRPLSIRTGRQVKLGDYFGKRPVILALVYYQCPILCSEELTGLVTALEMVDS